MAFIDDFKVKLEQSAQNIGNDINSYIQNRLTDAVVKIGEPPKGNQTAAQVAAGQTGQAQPLAVSASQVVSGFDFNKLLIPAAILAVGFFFLSKKSRG